MLSTKRTWRACGEQGEPHPKFLVPRRFPPPWSIDELEACFVVRDHDGQALAYVYFEDEPGRRSAAKLLTKDDGSVLTFKFLNAVAPGDCLDASRHHSFD
jgi:hypothetical protein